MYHNDKFPNKGLSKLIFSCTTQQEIHSLLFLVLDKKTTSEKKVVCLNKCGALLVHTYLA
jgi:hypothetical protein